MSIMDVARVAGVSKSTVSRVVNGGRRVSPETQERVRRAMRQLGYRPNDLARGLLRGRTNTIGLVLFNLANPYFAVLAQAAIAAAYDHGYFILLADSGGDAAKEAECLDILVQRRVDGVIVTPLDQEVTRYQRFQTGGLATILIDAPDFPSMTTVGIDNELGGRLATDHLLARGHRRIAFVDTPPRPAPDRLAGYRHAHALRNAPVDERLVKVGAHQQSDVRAAAQDLFRMEDPPTAIFAGNDYVALSILEVATESGLRVPEDVALVGFDDLPVSASLRIPLTSVARPIVEQGEIAVDLLLNKIAHPDASEQHVVLQPRLVVRASSGR